MANTSRISGFRPVFHLSGAHIQSRKYFIPSTDATAVGIGDPVKWAGSADTDGTAPTVQAATGATDIVLGIVVGFAVDPTNLNVGNQGRAASTARYCYVVDDPQVVFEAETSNGTPASADVALNVSHAIGTPSTTTGSSGATIDMGTKATTITLPFKILAFSSRIDNDNTAASAKVYVKINAHQLGGGTGALGVS